MNGENPSYSQGDQRPVERVSWDEVQIFLKNPEVLSGKPFRLPTARPRSSPTTS
jgi:formylglycine-generating enzyme required for sulfatase activity